MPSPMQPRFTCASGRSKVPRFPYRPVPAARGAPGPAATNRGGLRSGPHPQRGFLVDDASPGILHLAQRITQGFIPVKGLTQFAAAATDDVAGHRFGHQTPPVGPVVEIRWRNSLSSGILNQVLRTLGIPRGDSKHGAGQSHQAGHVGVDRGFKQLVCRLASHYVPLALLGLTAQDRIKLHIVQTTKNTQKSNNEFTFKENARTIPSMHSRTLRGWPMPLIRNSDSFMLLPRVVRRHR